jgi:hypothetical protein
MNHAGKIPRAGRWFKSNCRAVATRRLPNRGGRLESQRGRDLTRLADALAWGVAIPDGKHPAETARGDQFDARYRGFFDCFAAGWFFEAHEVLEPLWLEVRRESDGDFYKGLIQVAGAFVHFKKGRLPPGLALLALADSNLAKYPAPHAGLAMEDVRAQIACWRTLAEGGDNPLGMVPAPVLRAPATAPLD